MIGFVTIIVKRVKSEDDKVVDHTRAVGDLTERSELIRKHEQLVSINAEQDNDI